MTLNEQARRMTVTADTLATVPAPMTRAWAMPNANTFAMPPVAEFVARWIAGKTCIVDPFARDNPTGAKWSNDINKATAAGCHMDARGFLDWLHNNGVKVDCIIFDPPYSPTQIKRAYESAGLEVGREDTQSARLKKECRDRFRLIAAPGCVILSFGWNTVGMGEGWTTREVLLVDHGGDHNATLCMAQTLNS